MARRCWSATTAPTCIFMVREFKHAMRFLSAVSLCMAAVIALGVLSGCSSSPTEILVTVNSDFAVPSALERVAVQSFDGDGAKISERVFLIRASSDAPASGSFTLPISFAVVPTNGDVSRRAILNIQAFASGASTPTVERKAIMGFAEHQKLPLEIFLTAACVGVTCSSDKTCDIGGACVPIVVATNSRDASVDDASTLADMNTPTDAGLHDSSTHDAAQADASDGSALDLAVLDSGVLDGAAPDLGVVDAGAIPVPLYAGSPAQTIVEPSSGGNAFGVFLAVSADGTTLAVADSHDNSSTTVDGNIFIYTGTSSGFSSTPSQTLSKPSGISYFGFLGVALAGDSSSMFVCAQRSGTEQVTVVQYGMSGAGNFSYGGGFDLPSEVQGGYLVQIAANNDGSIVIASSASTASAYVYASGLGGSPDQTIPMASGSGAEGFGFGVAVSGDASTLVVGDDTSAHAAYIYTGGGGTFSSSPASSVSGSGTSVALRSDGLELVIGDRNGGTVKTYRRSGSTFSLSQTFHAPRGAGSNFGVSVAVTGDGKFVLAGDYASHVYVYQAE